MSTIDLKSKTAKANRDNWDAALKAADEAGDKLNMKSFNFTDAELQPLKELLFGLQKQANVQNDAVTLIVADQLAYYTGKYQFGDGNLADVVQETIKDMVDGTILKNETFIRLVCGNESCVITQQDGPKSVTKAYPNPESPKCEFRIRLLNSEAAATSNDINTKKAFLRKVLSEHPEFQEMLKPESTFYPGLDKNAKMKKLIKIYPEAFAGYTGDTYGVHETESDMRKLRKDMEQLNEENRGAAKESSEIEPTPKSAEKILASTIANLNEFTKEVETMEDPKDRVELTARVIFNMLPKATTAALLEKGLNKTEVALLYAEKYYYGRAGK